MSLGKVIVMVLEAEGAICEMARHDGEQPIPRKQPRHDSQGYSAQAFRTIAPTVRTRRDTRPPLRSAISFRRRGTRLVLAFLLLVLCSAGSFRPAEFDLEVNLATPNGNRPAKLKRGVDERRPPQSRNTARDCRGSFPEEGSIRVEIALSLTRTAMDPTRELGKLLLLGGIVPRCYRRIFFAFGWTIAFFA